MGKKNKKQKKGPALTGLAAALVKAGALDETKARKITREQRREDRQLSREELEEREAAKQTAAQERQAAEAEANRRRQAERDAAQAQERARRVVRDDLVPNLGGKTRWFFVARSGLIPFLEVDSLTARLLQSGSAGIVESQGAVAGPHAIVGQRALNTLHALDPEAVRYWNR